MSCGVHFFAAFAIALSALPVATAQTWGPTPAPTQNGTGFPAFLGPGWVRVRHAPAAPYPGAQEYWHPATDNCMGTNPHYGNPNDDSTAWTVTWDHYSVDSYLFATNNFTNWVVVKKDNFIGYNGYDFFSDGSAGVPTARMVSMSSADCSQHTQNMIYRSDSMQYPLDPMVKVQSNYSNGSVLGQFTVYAEAGIPASPWYGLEQHHGADVYVITQPPMLDSFVCQIMDPFYYGSSPAPSDSTPYPSRQYPWETSDQPGGEFYYPDMRCSEWRNWQGLAAGGPGTFQAGGMGQLAVSGIYEVWMCIPYHSCSAFYGDSFCYVWGEMSQRFHPWGSNSVLRLCGY